MDTTEFRLLVGTRGSTVRVSESISYHLAVCLLFELAYDGSELESKHCYPC